MPPSLVGPLFFADPGAVQIQDIHCAIFEKLICFVWPFDDRHARPIQRGIHQHRYAGQRVELLQDLIDGAGLFTRGLYSRGPIHVRDGWKLA